MQSWRAVTCTNNSQRQVFSDSWLNLAELQDVIVTKLRSNTTNWPLMLTSR